MRGASDLHQVAHHCDVSRCKYESTQNGLHRYDADHDTRPVSFFSLPAGDRTALIPVSGFDFTIGGSFMENEIEKRAAQLRHRKEEAEARDRVKERKQRTRRLIIEGALLESCCPEVKTMCITDIETYLKKRVAAENT